VKLSGFWIYFVGVAALSAQDLSTRASQILQKNCLMCHGGAKTSGLDLRTREGMLAGGERGPAIVPFMADDSKLFQFVSHTQQPAMPPGKSLSQADLETLRDWIDAGAPVTARKGGEASAKLEIRPFTPEEKNYWAFQKPTRATGGSIDEFLRAAMDSRGLKPTPRADRQVLIRRAYLDLLGLPPTPEEVEAFVRDGSPDAWPKLIDRLLASPHYGERWARHWLDLVRYADSDGFEFDRDRLEAWRYRDYVVNAFNSDKPYDQFIREQIAGDEYSSNSRESMIATGYLRLGPSGGGGGERGRQESLDDIISTTSLAFVGLTAGCARCHDHKFDPIPQADYYRLQAVFAPSRPVKFPLVAEDEVAKYNAEVDRINKLQRPLRQQKTAIEAPYKKQLVDEAVAKLPEYLQVAWRTPAAERTEGQKLNVQQIQKTLTNDSLANRISDAQMIARMTDEEKRTHAALLIEIDKLEKQKPAAYPSALAIGEAGRAAQPTYLLERGSLDARGPEVGPGVLSVLGDFKFAAPPEGASSTWRRRGFAEWIASPENPLTARVMVNRLWQHHFGEGIVRTPGNFGKLGEPPTHPELLDWLAVEFVERGWSIKAMHRVMMLSDSYQRSSAAIAANLTIDAENRYLWRMSQERLEAEAMRDQILAVAGSLDRTLGGPCVFPYISPDLFQSSTQRTWPGKSDDDPSTWRRSLYVFSKRSIRYPMFEAYDQPNLVNSCERRNRSTIAPQALLLMNNNFVIVQARQFAKRLRKEAGSDSQKQIQRAFALALGRAPTDAERSRAEEYMRGGPPRLEQFCQALFNLNEFVYRP
jgi:hypothetical protein